MVYRLSSVFQYHVRMPNSLTHRHLYFKFGERGSFIELKSRFTDRQKNSKFKKQKIPFRLGLVLGKIFSGAKTSKQYENNPVLTALCDSLAPNGLKINW